MLIQSINISWPIRLSLILMISILFSCGDGEELSNVYSLTIGGSGSDGSHDMKVAPDGSMVLAGLSDSNSDGNDLGDFWVIKLDESGSEIWETYIENDGSGEAFAIDLTSDGGCITAGETWGATNGYDENDFWVVKLDTNGQREWDKYLGGSGWDMPSSIKQTVDGGYIVVGETESNDFDVTSNKGGRDCWVVKLDNTGNIEWQRTLGGSDYDEAQDVVETSDGGLVIAAYASSNDGDVSTSNGDADFWLVKLDHTGTIQWEKSYGGSDGDYANAIEETADGGLIVGGSSSSNDGDVESNRGVGDVWALKLDENGEVEWKYSSGWTNWDGIYAVTQTMEGDYVLAGVSFQPNEETDHRGESDALVIKLDGNGNEIWRRLLGGSSGETIHSVYELPNGDYIIGGGTASNNGHINGLNGHGDSWIFKLNPQGNLVER